MATQHAITVTVRDSQNIIFEGQVERIASFNEVGPFDVYPQHANFISIIRQHLALYHKHEKVKELDLEQAVMKVKGDSVNIFLGIDALIVEEEENSLQQNSVKTTK